MNWQGRFKLIFFEEAALNFFEGFLDKDHRDKKTRGYFKFWQPNFACENQSSFGKRDVSRRKMHVAQKIRLQKVEHAVTSPTAVAAHCLNLGQEVARNRDKASPGPDRPVRPPRPIGLVHQPGVRTTLSTEILLNRRDRGGVGRNFSPSSPRYRMLQTRQHDKKKSSFKNCSY